MQPRTSDRTQRERSIPFRSVPYNNVTFDTFGYGDLRQISITGAPDYPGGLINPIRMTLPAKGDLTEAYFTFKGQSNGPLAFRLAIGRWQEDGGQPIPEAETSYTEAYIQQSHEALTGDSAYLTTSGPDDMIEINQLNIYPFIPRRGQEGFSEDGFILLFVFDEITPGAFGIYRFQVDGSAIMGAI